MGSGSKRCTAGFREQAVALCKRSNATCAAVARDPGIDDGTLPKWAREADGAAGDPGDDPFAMRDRVRQPRREGARPGEGDGTPLKASASFATRTT